MTECNPKSFEFARTRGRQVVADFLGGLLTTDAGALPLREVDRRIGLSRALSDAVPILGSPRRSSMPSSP